MTIQEIIKVFGDQGISYIATVALIVMAYKTWQYMMTKLNDVLGKISDRLDSLAKTIDDHDRSADERGKYIREEHRQMIEALGRINGYKS